MRLWLRGPLQAKAAKAQGTAGSVGERKTGRAPLRPRCLGRPMGTLSGSAGATLPPFPPHLCCRTTQGGLAACFEGETPLRRDTSPSGPAASAGFRWPPGSQRRREDQSAGLDAGGGVGVLFLRRKSRQTMQPRRPAGGSVTRPEAKRRRATLSSHAAAPRFPPPGAAAPPPIPPTPKRRGLALGPAPQGPSPVLPSPPGPPPRPFPQSHVIRSPRKEVTSTRLAANGRPACGGVRGERSGGAVGRWLRGRRLPGGGRGLSEGMAARRRAERCG